MEKIRDKVFGMSGEARAAMRQLFLSGPTDDGDIISKCGRGELCRLGYASHQMGYTWLTEVGMHFAIRSMLMNEEKEQWLRKRRSGR